MIEIQRWQRCGAIASLFIWIIATGAFPAPATGQTLPEVTANGQFGTITVNLNKNGGLVTIVGRGFDPDKLVEGSIRENTTCTESNQNISGPLGLPADAQGSFSFDFTFTTTGTYSLFMFEYLGSERQPNCLVFNVIDPPPPVLTSSGSQAPITRIAPTGPITFDASGFAAGESVAPSVYDNLQCFGEPSRTLSAGASELGTVSFDLEFNQSGSYTVTVDGAESGRTNCMLIDVSSAPTEVPDGPEDTIVTVTADPRFPVVGTAAIPNATTYTLDDLPDNGTVTLDPDGAYTYQALNLTLDGDQFTVTATGLHGTATVAIVITYAIDPNVPTTGFVSPGKGGSTGGGNSSDPRDPRSPITAPATTPAPELEEETESDDSCARCD
jgi:hypothetical protein